LALDESETYKSGMHDAEADLIRRNIESIFSALSGDVRFLDLGCGEALKTTEIAREAQNKGKHVIFYPIDVSKKILEIAVRNASQSGIEVYGLQEDFEQLENILQKVKPRGQRFVYLGANFVNFNSDSILKRISDNLTGGDATYFSAQISDGDISRIVSEYDTRDIGDFLFQTIKHLGFSPDHVRYRARFNQNKREIEMYFTVQTLPRELRNSRLKVGDELVVATSFKPTLNEFTKIAQKYFNGKLLFNEDRTYVGFVGNKKSVL
jgi:uncharacterized SAM-dependent methyltransferase